MDRSVKKPCGKKRARSSGPSKNADIMDIDSCRPNHETSHSWYPISDPPVLHWLQNHKPEKGILVEPWTDIAWYGLGFGFQSRVAQKIMVAVRDRGMLCPDLKMLRAIIIDPEDVVAALFDAAMWVINRCDELERAKSDDLQAVEVALVQAKTVMEDGPERIGNSPKGILQLVMWGMLQSVAYVKRILEPKLEDIDDQVISLVRAKRALPDSS